MSRNPPHEEVRPAPTAAPDPTRAERVRERLLARAAADAGATAPTRPIVIVRFFSR